MSVYPWVAAYAFRRHAAYPLGTIAEAVTNTLFGFVRAWIVLALWAARPSLGGYDAADAVTFCFITQALIGPVQVFGGLELTQRIRSGDVAIDLHRPVDLQGWWLADDLGRGACTLLLRGGLPMVAGALAFDLRLPGAAGWAAFAVSVALAVITGFGLRYLVAMAMFWLHDDRGLQAVALVLSMFFSGMILPLVAFPGWLGTLAQALPWAALIQVPADVFLGEYRGAGLLAAYGFQAMWAVVLLGAGRVLTSAARRRLVIHGG
ncbi:ABC transporter permease [Thermomonospora umbrina]|uniref:ABC-2 type transport system permease protein n=1 Tax=Thermomonospora umbrina TaxID=111806 RepID=A0A3D9T622_9ACTN|nr:ABC-2 family transporter protein [Thermomonospora umbrina]REF00145.1 ABC-2 type transport system permease protein [Thermomonospora umbrina]